MSAAANKKQHSVSPTLGDDSELDMDNLDDLLSDTTQESVEQPATVVEKRKPDHSVSEKQHEAKRPTNRLNQAQAVTTAAGDSTGDAASKALLAVVNRNAASSGVTTLVPKPILPGVYTMPKRIGSHSTVFGLADDLGNLKVLAAAGESIYVDVNYYIVNLTDAKQKAFFQKNLRRMVTRAQADEAIGLQRAFRVGPICVVGALAKPLGMLGEMSQAREGTPRFAMRNQMLILGPTEDPKDAEPQYHRTADGRFVRIPPYKHTAENSLNELKRVIKHLFGCIYDGDPFGTTALRQKCLEEVLTEMSREHAGSQLSLPAVNAATLDEADSEATLTLASGQVLTIDDPEVKKRVRERFIYKGVAPFVANSTNEAVRKSTHWSAQDTVLRARRKVFRRMTAKEEEQAKKTQPGQLRPVWGSWPADRPEPSKEDFDDPNKVAECTWYANSKGYITTPIVYKDQHGKDYEIPLEEAPNEEQGKDEPPVTEAPVAVAQDGAPMVFVYKRPKYAPRVLTNGSIVGVDLRLRLWCNKPSTNNPNGSYGVHVDFCPTIIMVDRRETNIGSDNCNMTDAFAADVSEEEMSRFIVDNTAEFAPMVAVGEA